MAKEKRIFFHEMRKHDYQNNDTIVRELEMAADSAITAPGYTIQFWRDVQTYGVEEAILYVANGNYGNAEAIREKWNQIKTRIKRSD